MDYIDFVVHVFVHERRSFYRLERLWGDAPRLDLSSKLGGAGRLARPSPSHGHA